MSTPQTEHDPGRVLADLAVAIADGGECISDIATLADQPGLFGATASDSTVWRLLSRLTDADLAALGSARAAAREMVRAQRAETRGRPTRRPSWPAGSCRDTCSPWMPRW